MRILPLLWRKTLITRPFAGVALTFAILALILTAGCGGHGGYGGGNIEVDSSVEINPNTSTGSSYPTPVPSGDASTDRFTGEFTSANGSPGYLTDAKVENGELTATATDVATGEQGTAYGMVDDDGSFTVIIDYPSGSDTGDGTLD